MLTLLVLQGPDKGRRFELPELRAWLSRIGFADYEEKTTRVIPVVELTRR